MWNSYKLFWQNPESRPLAHIGKGLTAIEIEYLGDLVSV
ncbi:hypothetical protein BLL52_0574 [Rhodoferax antarcticus ANT.BR]|uniref:Uncharacterized protein n=1 Tax=Rhodoferax antarcticus ANT.BR TaxID=1111071 RepID=A0A1Q8YJR9_9BURK|nr:hypothetical protein BLL52_0574 [Rhodoferax antarcticus ANT.BR]